MRTDGGPAFPRTEYEGLPLGTEGMSLRDYFAGQALGLLQHHSAVNVAQIAGGGPRDEQQANFAHWAYQMADAMLVERGGSDDG